MPHNTGNYTGDEGFLIEPEVCPTPNPQTCCQVAVEFKTQFVPPALASEDVTTEVFFTQPPVVEDVCPEKVIICGTVAKRITYTAVDEQGNQCPKVICDERPFQCIIDREDANEGDTFQVCGFAILCEGTPRLQNRGTRPGPTPGSAPVDVFWKVLEKDIVKVCIRKNDCNDCEPLLPPRVLVYVTNSGGDPADDTVSVISTATNTEIARILVGDNPSGIAISPDGSRAYVTNSFDNNVSVINTVTNTEILPRIPVGGGPFGIAITPNGLRAYVVNFDDSNVSVINTATNTEILPRIPVGGGPVSIAITPDGSRAYVTNSFDDTVSVINTATNTEILPRISVGELPIGIAITPDGSRAYVTTGLGDGSGDTISVINTATNTEILPRIPVGDAPRGIAITPDGSRAYVTNLFDNNISVINTATNTEILPRIPVGNRPIRIAITPDGSRAYVTNIDDNNVSVINTATNTEILPRIPVGDFPFAIAIAITPNCV